MTLSVLPPTQARQLLQDYQEAIADFQEVQKIEPNNKAAKTQIVMSRNQLKRRRDQEKRRFANMFDKFAAEDERWVHVAPIETRQPLLQLCITYSTVCRGEPGVGWKNYITQPSLIAAVKLDPIKIWHCPCG